MTEFRLRTKLILSLILISSGLATATVLIVRHEVQKRAQADIEEALRNSVVTFQNFQREREATLMRSAGLLADLPILRALMTTEHAATIQDGSLDLWQLAKSDLFLLADSEGRVVALHTSAQGFTREEAGKVLRHSLRSSEESAWWFGEGHLYRVFLKPIYFGPPVGGSTLGVLGVGYEVNSSVAQEVSQIASSEVAFRYDGNVVVTTLTPRQQAQLNARHDYLSGDNNQTLQVLRLAGEQFLATSLKLSLTNDPGVSLTVLKSYDQATIFLRNLNRWTFGIGLAAILVGTGLAFLLSHTFTRPLDHLLSGVHALQKGDYGYPLLAESGDEVGELTSAFNRMRESLRETQNELLHAERLATMGQMASAISHDLRHPLTAILAYAEFLSETKLPDQQRKDFYEEIRQAVNRMADLIGSMLEFAKTRQNLNPVYCSIEDSIRRAIQSVQTKAEFRRIAITTWHEGRCEGWFDSVKLERVFHNLLMNACEAVSPETGIIEIRIRQIPAGVEVKLTDNGHGIPQPIAETIFAPFVSYGKENGTGLGLAVARKMVQDHGGNICVERTGREGTVFMLTIPIGHPLDPSTKS
ncbi:MAG TPA: HAMP domain-containing sensor histidine kinase [Terriglobia bacterium]|nr:HAMP domain-containing sensor histidine kinase [Terriglobia bacterium]